MNRPLVLARAPGADAIDDELTVMEVEGQLAAEDEAARAVMAAASGRWRTRVRKSLSGSTGEFRGIMAARATSTSGS